MLHTPLQLESPEVPGHSCTSGRARSYPYPRQAARWNRSWSHPGALGKHGRRMQLSVTHFWEAALAKDANSQFSPHHPALAAQVQPFQSLGFSNSLPTPRRKRWQGTAGSCTAMGSNEILVLCSQASQSGVECGQKIMTNASQHSLSVRESCSIIFSVTLPGSHIESMQKLLHS